MVCSRYTKADNTPNKLGIDPNLVHGLEILLEPISLGAGIGLFFVAQELFIRMPKNDVISWKTVLNGHASNGDDTWMLVDGNAAATRVNVFSACARLGALDLGKYMRVQIVMDTGEMYMLGIL
ncbi:hypothetical protein DKX38_015730 [Salix brachista]|uniref:Uncharacterized protein n=1 Tax=Salix brachista TaxID=2182728 RepID=A0A5N5L612_9ROSI|nr:hypothetical protein DKX38_015730 [Salix brachista]